ncbi:hypothetical protein PISMIDRAFT_350688 [Pisolithus microcarpus 441]|uniref:Uncharacterized protein n=1 Tax=Pisolithus microcarpus 441 TaxID=765257 RepID=A0A0C9YWM0_9AGAM|nr:hypothetical protein PISMIDRAFT_350688 [Pisolithus microcarpus 441]
MRNLLQQCHRHKILRLAHTYVPLSFLPCNSSRSRCLVAARSLTFHLTTPRIRTINTGHRPHFA